MSDEPLLQQSWQAARLKALFQPFPSPLASSDGVRCQGKGNADCQTTACQCASVSSRISFPLAPYTHPTNGRGGVGGGNGPVSISPLIWGPANAFMLCCLHVLHEL